MRYYNGCPDKELQAVIDDNKAAREALAGMGVRAVYFPGEEMFMGFDTEHRAVTGFCHSARAVLNNLKGKTMKFDSVEFVIGSWFASAIINGDYSGLDDAEERMLNRFRDSVEAKHGQGHWNGFGEDDCVGFALCEVSGLRGDCYVARYCFAVKEETKCQ